MADESTVPFEPTMVAMNMAAIVSTATHVDEGTRDRDRAMEILRREWGRPLLKEWDQPLSSALVRASSKDVLQWSEVVRLSQTSEYRPTSSQWTYFVVFHLRDGSEVRSDSVSMEEVSSIFEGFLRQWHLFHEFHLR